MPHAVVEARSHRRPDRLPTAGLQGRRDAAVRVQQAVDGTAARAQHAAAAARAVHAKHAVGPVAPHGGRQRLDGSQEGAKVRCDGRRRQVVDHVAFQQQLDGQLAAAVRHVRAGATAETQSQQAASDRECSVLYRC